MAYKVLYRKYRPQNFDELYGQNNIKSILLESIKSDKIAHAYLFFGPRGTGKTSTAKLFAKAVNCENFIDNHICNKCSSCLNSENSADIIEIDAASNNGVDEIRELRENAKILPTSSKYKVYIIDEVHMLSQSAWNAFLKILEEPPKHVIFILATTEIQKVPITILSRCQRFSFNKIDQKEIANNLLKITKKEKIEITEEAISYISKLSDGGMRDALSILDQLSKENCLIDIELIKENFGIVSDIDVKNLIESIKNQNFKDFSNYFKLYEEKNVDSKLLINAIINHLYDLAYNSVQSENQIFKITDIKNLCFDLSNCYNKENSLQLVKLVLLDFIDKNIISREINFSEKTDDISLTNEKVKYPIKTKKIVEPLELKKKNTDLEELIKIRINNSFYGANKKLKTEFLNNWNDYCVLVENKNNFDLLSLVEDKNPEVVSKTHILFSTNNQSSSLIFDEQVLNIENDFNKIYKTNYKFICIDNERWIKEKNNYINNKTFNYEYIEETKIINKKNKVESSAEHMFNDSIIEIR